MAAEILICEAEQEDLPKMIEICCNAVASDIITSFLYGFQPGEAVRKQTESLTASLGRRFTQPTNKCHIHKAVDVITGDLIGWILVKWEEGDPYALPPDYKVEAGNFAAYYGKEIKHAWSRLLAGESHVGKSLFLGWKGHKCLLTILPAIGAIYVKPGYQRNGVGRQLVEFIYSEYDLHKELVIAQTRCVSEGFYKRLGWITAESTDIDLSEWGGKGMGYGLHRSPQMMRYPES